MENVWVLAVVWVGLALIATLFAIRLKLSPAVTEIVGTVAQFIIGAATVSASLGAKSDQSSFLAKASGVVWTFLAEAKLDPASRISKFKEPVVRSVPERVRRYGLCLAMVTAEVADGNPVS